MDVLSQLRYLALAGNELVVQATTPAELRIARAELKLFRRELLSQRRAAAAKARADVSLLRTSIPSKQKMFRSVMTETIQAEVLAFDGKLRAVDLAMHMVEAALMGKSAT